jgi:hypothetical protein
MQLVETRILHSSMASIEWVNPFEPELDLFGCIRQPKWTSPIVEHGLAVLGITRK